MRFWLHWQRAACWRPCWLTLTPAGHAWRLWALVAGSAEAGSAAAEWPQGTGGCWHTAAELQRRMVAAPWGDHRPEALMLTALLPAGRPASGKALGRPTW